MYEQRSNSLRGQKSGVVRRKPPPSQRIQQVEQVSSGMYSDQIDVGSRKRPVRERLNGVSDASAGRQSVNKRQRQDDGKWKHDLYDDDDGDSGIEGPSGTQDLRSRLTRKNPLRSSQSASAVSGARPAPRQDLRQRLSGPIISPASAAREPEKRKIPSSVVRASTASASVAPPRPMVPRSNAPSAKNQSASEQNVASFLTSLGLEKYLLTFQAEEVDMTALRHMRDEDLKELNVPMGPRKKILLALASRN